MSEVISKAIPLLDELKYLGIHDERVLNVMGNIPRELFLPPTLTHKAWQNTALPIGQGQTLSQPYTVARMTQTLLAHCPVPVAEAKVLEIGTGSGYQTAVLAQLFGQVCSVERVNTLKFQAKRRLNHLDCHNVKLRYGDGWEGWPGQAPFACMIVTAAPATVPDALIEQLDMGGALLIPVGATEQQLTLLQTTAHGIEQQILEDARFVPLIQGALQ